MFFGFPLRTTMADHGLGEDPLVGRFLPALGDELLVGELGDVGLEGEVHLVGLEPAMTARAWSPEAP